MKIKPLVFVIVAGIGLSLNTQGELIPDWSGDDGSVHAEWYTWGGMEIGSTSMSDTFNVIDKNGVPLASVFGMDNADAMKTSALFGSDADGEWLELVENWDLSFWMPSFSGFDAQEGMIQFSYWDDQSDPSWRAGLDLSIQLYGGTDSQIAGALVYQGEEHDMLNGLITEGWSFSIENSADGFFVDVAANPSIMPGSIYLDSVTIDTLSYDAIPEPASGAFMLVGTVLLSRIRKKMKC